MSANRMISMGKGVFVIGTESGRNVNRISVNTITKSMRPTTGMTSVKKGASVIGTESGRIVNRISASAIITSIMSTNGMISMTKGASVIGTENGRIVNATLLRPPPPPPKTVIVGRIFMEKNIRSENGMITKDKLACVRLKIIVGIGRVNGRVVVIIITTIIMAILIMMNGGVKQPLNLSVMITIFRFCVRPYTDCIYLIR